MLQDQLDGKCRLRLVLREAVDPAGRDTRRKNPYWLWSYDLGVSTITSVAEILPWRGRGNVIATAGLALLDIAKVR